MVLFYLSAAETNRCFSCSYARVKYGDSLLQYGDESCVQAIGISYVDCPDNMCIVSTTPYFNWIKFTMVFGLIM